MRRNGPATPIHSPQMGMGAFVNYFFSGFILGRVPFSLSPKFRPMLQRGIDLPALDPSYFTSLSFYIMALFGLGGVFRLMFAEDAINDAAQMAQMQMGGMGGGGPPTLDPAKAYEAERQALDVVRILGARDQGRGDRILVCAHAGLQWLGASIVYCGYHQDQVFNPGATFHQGGVSLPAGEL